MADYVFDSLLVAILASPDDDTPRLALADALDERAAENPTKPCPNCGSGSEPGWVHRYGKYGPGYYTCPVCTDTDAGQERGSGTVPDTSLADRAEFIRVQVELARREATGCEWCRGTPGRINCRTPCICAIPELRDRERELLANVARSDFGDRHTVRDAGVSVYLDTPLGGKNPQRGTIEVTYRRGFVAAVTCTAADWDEHAPALVWHPSSGHPCPETAQPIVKVTLTTVPEMLCFDRGMIMYHFPGRKTHQLKGIFITEREVMMSLLAAEWPGIRFELPSRVSAAHV